MPCETFGHGGRGPPNDSSSTFCFDQRSRRAITMTKTLDVAFVRPPVTGVGAARDRPARRGSCTARTSREGPRPRPAYVNSPISGLGVRGIHCQSMESDDRFRVSATAPTEGDHQKMLDWTLALAGGEGTRRCTDDTAVWHPMPAACAIGVRVCAAGRPVRRRSCAITTRSSSTRTQPRVRDAERSVSQRTCKAPTGRT
jgi:hypothetical protein